MTNELEKQFFDTFGIELKCQNTFINPSKCPFIESKECCDCVSFEYPQITDRILLELICTLNKFTGYTSLLNDTYEEVQEEILKDVLFAHEQLKIHKADLSKQVRTLFEEG